MKKIFILIIGFLLIPFVYASSYIEMYPQKGNNLKDIKKGDIITINYIVKCTDNCEDNIIEKGKATIYYDSNIFSIVEEENKSFVSNIFILDEVTGYSKSVTQSKNQLVEYAFHSNYISIEKDVENIVISLKLQVKENVFEQDTTIYSNYETDYVKCVEERCGKGIKNDLDFHIKGLSNESTLSSLSVNKGKLMPEFDKDINSYVVYVDYNVSNINIGAKCNKCQIKGLGNKALETGENKYIISTIAETGKESKYYLTVVRANDDRSSDSKLKNVVIKNGSTTIPYDFVTTLYNYNITVAYDVKKLNFEIALNDAKAKYEAYESLNLKVGDNKYSIKVTAENGMETEYIYNIKRLDENEAILKDLKIYGYELMPSFDPNIYEYTINYDKRTNSLDFGYELNTPSSKVNIFGNSNLKNNPNDIKIKVMGDTKGNEMTYIIHLNEVPSTGNLYVVIGILGTITLGLTITVIVLSKKYRVLKDKSA